jgi:hypothetical protein
MKNSTTVFVIITIMLAGITLSAIGRVFYLEGKADLKQFMNDNDIRRFEIIRDCKPENKVPAHITRWQGKPDREPPQ